MKKGKTNVNKGREVRWEKRKGEEKTGNETKKKKGLKKKRKKKAPKEGKNIRKNNEKLKQWKRLRNEWKK